MVEVNVLSHAVKFVFVCGCENFIKIRGVKAVGPSKFPLPSSCLVSLSRLSISPRHQSLLSGCGVYINQQGTNSDCRDYCLPHLGWQVGKGDAWGSLPPVNSDILFKSSHCTVALHENVQAVDLILAYQTRINHLVVLNLSFQHDCFHIILIDDISLVLACKRFF